VNYLLDSNVWLELLLTRKNAVDVRRLLAAIPGRRLVISTFSLHSVGVYVAKRRPDLFLDFLDDLTSSNNAVVGLSVAEIARALRSMQSYGLDFDDAFQFTVAEIHDLRIVSFDSDFDRTPRGRMTPEQVLADEERA
jgi:uncharacterized protein